MPTLCYTQHPFVNPFTINPSQLASDEATSRAHWGTCRRSGFLLTSSPSMLPWTRVRTRTGDEWVEVTQMAGQIGDQHRFFHRDGWTSIKISQKVMFTKGIWLLTHPPNDLNRSGDVGVYWGRPFLHDSTVRSHHHIATIHNVIPIGHQGILRISIFPWMEIKK
jgi:hypothetical protein